MTTEIVFETHSTSEDNERGVASGWAHSRLSAVGNEQAAAVGERRRADRVSAVFASDLRRAVETANVAFGTSSIPILLDWRLRECDYGTATRMPASELHATRHAHLDTPYPGGESWREAVERVARFLADVPLRWDGLRVVVIGHVATRWALDHVIGGKPLEDLVAEDFVWQEGWEYVLR